MKITDEEIKRISSPTIYRRGVEYEREGRVHLRVRDKNEIVSVVDGEEIYNVGIHLDDDGHITDSFCTCPYFRTMDCTCKHIVATLKLRQRELAEGAVSGGENDRIAAELCARFAREEQKIHLNLAVTLRIHTLPNGIKYSAALAVGEGAPEPVGGIEAFLAAYAGEGSYKLSKFRSFSREKYEFSENDAAILDILSENCQNRLAAGFYTQKLASTEFGAMTAKRLFPHLDRAHAEFIVNDVRLPDMQIKKENPDITIDVSATDRQITLCVPECGTALLPDGSRFLFSGDMYITDGAWRENYMPIYSCLGGGARTQMDFANENSIAFASKVLPRLRNMHGVVLENVDEVVICEKPTFDVYFDARGLAVNAVIIAHYGSISLRLPTNDDGGRIIVRSVEDENKIMRFFGAFRLTDSGYLLDDSDEIYKFLFEDFDALCEVCTVTESESFAAMRKKTVPKFNLKVDYREESGLLHFSFDTDMSPEEVSGILSAVRLRKKFYRTKDGAFVALGTKTGAAEILNYLDFTAEDIKKGSKDIPRYHALYISALAQSGGVKTGERFDAFINGIRAVRADIPAAIDAVLRGYQRDAVNWLAQLDEAGFGGILADDMGLGKTLEVIAFVMSRKREKPSLVVAPSALLYNWQKEINRFAPGARAMIIDGTREERANKLDNIGGADFVITSYPLLRRDGALYKDIDFDYCFVDEAQYIKNPKTMNARGVKRINAKNRFALTGTPVENSLTELWSIFDFVMPSYLGSRHSFAENYEKPVSQGVIGAQDMLRARIKPFVMRRMKKDVLAELPEKIEDTVFSELLPEQKALYRAYMKTARRELDRIFAEGESELMILSLLTRLRQICCHPALFDENYTKGSGKLELLCELVDSAVAGGHRVLVFSQFTSMLKIIRETLLQKGFDSFYLDGSTPPQLRSELADRFNGGEKNVFLISLKAGGTGLNLIGADTVIHYDPWWNPAVTDQASDRAYRMGQSRAVHIMRLAASGTIEEQILKLQNRKRALADGIIIQNSASLSNLSKEELLSLFTEPE